MMCLYNLCGLDLIINSWCLSDFYMKERNFFALQGALSCPVEQGKAENFWTVQDGTGLTGQVGWTGQDNRTGQGRKTCPVAISDLNGPHSFIFYLNISRMKQNNECQDENVIKDFVQ